MSQFVTSLLNVYSSSRSCRQYDLTYLKLLLVIQRRGHTTKNGMPGDAMMIDMNCLCDGEVDDCEVLSYAVQPCVNPIVPGEKLYSFDPPTPL